MDEALKRIVADVKRYAATNPPTEDAGTVLQKEIVAKGLENDFSEAEISEAAIELGVPPGDLPGWLEDMASWL